MNLNTSMIKLNLINKLKVHCFSNTTRWCLIFFWLNAAPLIAALPAGPILVTATADTNQIRIGEQFKIILKANVPNGINLKFPVFPDSLGALEIISRGSIDTILAGDKSNITMTQSLQVTSFDSGYYVVEPFHFTSLNPETGYSDTLSTEAFLISVKTVPVDTTQAIKDIKAPLEVELTWQEILFIVLLVALGIFLIWFFIRLWKNRKVKVAPLLPKIPDKPAYEIALEALKKTEQEKLWQQGFYKPYHSAVSDILREYIERSFDINALELTSDETLERINRQRLADGLSERLAYILHTADLVKFAKLIPMADENEKTIRYAYDFIHATRPVIPTDISRKENEA